MLDKSSYICQKCSGVVKNGLVHLDQKQCAKELLKSKQPHRPDCRLALVVNSAAGIECPHGYDVCPTCDPCHCFDEKPAKAEDKKVSQTS